ncbi:MAG: sigma-70 family RNA polymerase sigma factor [Planctomycetota bacterium]|nr:sigma-70 family RNA polymerase sigma factor [Planctomycetota bacterium]
MPALVLPNFSALTPVHPLMSDARDHAWADEAGAPACDPVATNRWSVPDLTRGIRRGDHAAFNAFYARWFTHCLACARAISRSDEATCLDLVQETMLRVVRRAPVLDEERQLAAWLVRVVRSCALDRARSDARRANRERVFQSGARASVEDTPIDSSELALLRRALAALPPSEVELLVLRFQGRLTLEQMATSTDIPRDAAHGRVRRGLQRLRTLLAPATNHPRDPRGQA